MKTNISVVLDRSGSMGSVLEATIEGFNKFLADQKKENPQARFTLVKFDNEYEIVHEDAPIDLVPELNTKTFVPRGTTALRDAIGRTILSADVAGDDDNTKRIFVIITDGHENASKEFSQSEIDKMISERRKNGWEFIFLAANQDAIATASAMSIPTGNALSYASTNKGTTLAFDSISRAVTSYSVSSEVNNAQLFDDGDRSRQDSEITGS